MSVAIILSIGIATILLSINYFNDISYHYVRLKEYETMVPDTIDVVVPMNEEDIRMQGDYDEEYEGEQEEENTYSFASLWDKPEEDKKNIEDVMLYAIDNILCTTCESDFGYIISRPLKRS